MPPAPCSHAGARRARRVRKTGCGEPAFSIASAWRVQPMRAGGADCERRRRFCCAVTLANESFMNLLPCLARRHGGGGAGGRPSMNSSMLAKLVAFANGGGAALGVGR